MGELVQAANAIRGEQGLLPRAQLGVWQAGELGAALLPGTLLIL